MATCVCGAPVVYKVLDDKRVPVEQHEEAGAGPDRYVERDGRLAPVTARYEGMAWKLHACARLSRGGDSARSSGGEVAG